jgi:hypothetical protein
MVQVKKWQGFDQIWGWLLLWQSQGYLRHEWILYEYASWYVIITVSYSVVVVATFVPVPFTTMLLFSATIQHYIMQNTATPAKRFNGTPSRGRPIR